MVANRVRSAGCHRSKDERHSADGTELLTRHWPAVNPWAAVLVVHGLGEHSGRYEHVGAQLAAAGIDAYGFDNRGNGGSGGRPGHVDRWSQYLDDLGERLVAVRLVASDRPVVVYGHSLGGLIVTDYCLSDRPKPDLVVLSAPALLRHELHNEPEGPSVVKDVIDWLRSGGAAPGGGRGQAP